MQSKYKYVLGAGVLAGAWFGGKKVVEAASGFELPSLPDVPTWAYVAGGLAAAAAAYKLKRKSDDGELSLPGGGSGSSKRGAYKPLRSFNFDVSRYNAPKELAGGDNNYVAQDSEGAIYSAMCDMPYNSPNRETVIFKMDHAGAEPVRVAWRRGKCNGLIVIDDELYALVTDKGSLWEGTQNARIYKLVNGKLVPHQTKKMQGLPKASHLDVFWTFATHGWNEQYADGFVYAAAVRASKEKFDDYKPVPNISGSGQVHMWRIKKADFIAGKGNWAPMGTAKKAGGGAMITQRKHVNYISLQWVQSHGCYVLALGDFHSKTVTLCYSKTVNKGYTMKGTMASPALHGSPWGAINRKAGVPERPGLSPIKGKDVYYHGVAWCLCIFKDSHQGWMMAIGGWPGKYDAGRFVGVKMG